MSDKRPRGPRVFAMPENNDEQNKTASTAKTPNRNAKGRKPRVKEAEAVITQLPLEAAELRMTGEALAAELDAELTPPPPPVKKRRIGWSSLFFAALGGIVSLGVGLWIDQLIRDLFARQDILGWLAVGLTGLLVLAAFVIVARELLGLRRMAKIGVYRDRGEEARSFNDLKAARRLTNDLVALYQDRVETTAGRAQLAAHAKEIIDGRDLVHLMERDLLRPLDAEARARVMASAKRVSVVTAVSPRALVDISYVLLENMRLIRSIAELYGGRPGTIGFWRLARNVLTHLAVTGSIAIGDSLLQQVVGQGLAARLSSRLGEGVVNGLLTARIGISAIDVCRPLEFSDQTRPRIGDFLSELTASWRSVDDTDVHKS